jgi:hypothetical protein
MLSSTSFEPATNYNFPLCLHDIAKTTLCRLRNAESTEDLDTTLCARMAEEEDIGKSTEEFHVILKTTCDTTYKKPSTIKKTTAHKSVPWWTQELTVVRKRTNALRRRHQKTRNNGVLRDRRKVQYLESKAQYAATIKREKLRSWKEYVL